MPLDISAARRLVTIAQNRIADEQDLEDEVFAEWELNAIEFISCPELLDILFEVVDDEIRAASNRGENTCKFGFTRGNRLCRSNTQKNCLFSRYAIVNNEDEPVRREISNLARTFNFMNVDLYAGLMDLMELVWLTMTDIIAPIYNDNGYEVVVATYPGDVRKIFSENWISEALQISW